MGVITFQRTRSLRKIVQNWKGYIVTILRHFWFSLSSREIQSRLSRTDKLEQRILPPLLGFPQASILTKTSLYPNATSGLMLLEAMLEFG